MPMVSYLIGAFTIRDPEAIRLAGIVCRRRCRIGQSLRTLNVDRKVGPAVSHVKKHFALCAWWNFSAVSMHLDACSRHIFEVSIALPPPKEDKTASGRWANWRNRLVPRWPASTRSGFHISALQGSVHILAE